jgi:hypothetical protein
MKLGNLVLRDPLRALAVLDLFNNPVGCFTSLADLADFLQKSAVFQRKLFNN